MQIIETEISMQSQVNSKVYEEIVQNENWHQLLSFSENEAIGVVCKGYFLEGSENLQDVHIMKEI